MRSRIAFLIIVAALAVSLVSLVFGLGSDFGGKGHGMSGVIPPSLWLVLIGAPLFVAIFVFGSAMFFPELSEKKIEDEPSPLPVVEKGESNLDAVLRVLKEDERKVIEAIVAEGGTMLQKDIRWKTGFSRVKTHRILVRLAERGIVSAEKHYNTNKITLADWLMTDKNN